MLCVINWKKINSNKFMGNKQCNSHLPFPGQHYSFKGFFQNFHTYDHFQGFENSTLNSRTFQTFPGSVWMLHKGAVLHKWFPTVFGLVTLTDCRNCHLFHNFYILHDNLILLQIFTVKFPISSVSTVSVQSRDPWLTSRRLLASVSCGWESCGRGCLCSRATQRSRPPRSWRGSESTWGLALRDIHEAFHTARE